MNNRVYNLYFSRSLLFLFLVLHSKLFASDIAQIRGWFHAQFPQHPKQLTADPILGRMACPSLVQYSASKNTMDGLILKRITMNNPMQWTFILRPGIYFWNGEEVFGKHLKTFIEAELERAVKTRLGSEVDIPSFTTKALERYRMQINWASNPPIGPFILEGLPFFRTKNRSVYGVPFECAGRFYPKTVGGDRNVLFTLDANRKYSGRTEQLEFLDQKAKLSSKKYVDIVWPKKILPKAKAFQKAGHYDCSPVVLPVFSALSWNRKRQDAWTPKQIQKFNELFPFREWVRLSTNGMGKYLDSPVPFSKAVRSLSHLSEQAIQKLPVVKLGKKTWPQQKAFQSAMNSMGIKSQVDTAITDLDWKPFRLTNAGLGLFEIFHSESERQTFPNFRHSNFLDQAIIDFSVGISFGKASFKSLSKKLNSAFNRDVPLSGLLQHGVCIKTSGMRRVSPKYGDPDWFRKLIP